MKIAAGLLIYKIVNSQPKFLLVHPGGPQNARRDLGAWSISKGIVEEGEDLLGTAIREVQEELGIDLSQVAKKSYKYLGEVKQKNNKLVHAWSLELDLPEKFIPNSNTATIEWPPHSGKQLTVPEVDQAEYFDLETARRKIVGAQSALLDRASSA